MSNEHPGLNKPFDVTEHVEATPGQMDMRDHLKTWHGFVSFVKWGILGNVLILVFLAIFRTH